MTAVEYITSAFCATWAEEDPQHITPEESPAIIAEMLADGVMCPPTVTPLLFSKVWNILCDKHTAI